MSTTTYEPPTKLITTPELIELLKKSAGGVEASLQLAGGLQTTHFLDYCGGVLIDSFGIDDDEYETTLEEFANNPLYGDPRARWRIWVDGQDDWEDKA